MGEIAIHTDKLTYVVNGVRAVDDLSLEVPAGAIFGFLGAGGSGKTTTIRLLLGLLLPTAGHAYVLGYDTRSHGDLIRQRTGALLEQAGPYARLDAQDNLDFYGRIWHMNRGLRTARAHGLLCHFGLQEHPHEAVGAWSPEMQRRLSVARTFFHRPSLVFLDEPTSGLEPEAAADLRGDIATLAAREAVTVFLTTRSPTEAEELCDLVGVLQAGRLLAIGAPAELRRRSATTRLEVRGRGFTDSVVHLLCQRPEVTHAACQGSHLIVDLVGSADPAPLVSLLRESSVDVDEVRHSRTNLATLLAALGDEGV